MGADAEVDDQRVHDERHEDVLRNQLPGLIPHVVPCKVEAEGDEQRAHADAEAPPPRLMRGVDGPTDAEPGDGREAHVQARPGYEPQAPHLKHANPVRGGVHNRPHGGIQAVLKDLKTPAHKGADDEAVPGSVELAEAEEDENHAEGLGKFLRVGTTPGHHGFLPAQTHGEVGQWGR